VTSSRAFVNIYPPTYSILADNLTNDPSCLLLSGNILYGASQSGFGTVYSVGIDGTGFMTLHAFDADDGAYSGTGLVLSGPTLYGTTEDGGPLGRGVVFSINTNGSGFDVLQDFDVADFFAPVGNLVSSGSTLYGTLFRTEGSGLESLFSLNANGSGYEEFGTFARTNGYPGGLLLSGSTLFGSTTNTQFGPSGGLFTILPYFPGGNNLNYCSGPMVLAGGTLYGTTYYGGSSNRGTVFKINTNGSGFAVLKNSLGGVDGQNPAGGLVLVGSMLYGTTQYGGILNVSNNSPTFQIGTNFGTVFQIDTNGSNYAVLKRFRGTDGGNPVTTLASSGAP